jgi:hypothetical protein
MAVKLTDGHFALAQQGEIDERRAHPRVPGSFKAASDAAYQTLRESSKREETAQEAHETRIEASQSLAAWFDSILDKAKESIS